MKFGLLCWNQESDNMKSFEILPGIFFPLKFKLVFEMLVIQIIDGQLLTVQILMVYYWQSIFDSP